MQKSKDKFVPLHDDLMFKYIFGYQENSKFIIDLLEEFFNVDKWMFKNSVSFPHTSILEGKKNGTLCLLTKGYY